MEVGIFHNDPVLCLPNTRGVTMTSHDVEAAMQELSPKLLLGKEAFSVKSRMEEKYDYPAPKKGNRLLEQKWWFEGHDIVFFWDGRFLRDHVSFSGIHMKIEV